MKAAVVAVVGRTNAGKSTLVNALVGEKVSIVSPVEQTTRNTVRGIAVDERGQLVLLDTPGLHKAVGELGRLLNRKARRTAAGADILCVMFDASQAPQLEDLGWMQRVANERPQKVLFALNKADKKPFFETEYHKAWDEIPKEAPLDAAWVKCAASLPGGERDVMDALFALADEGEALFPDDIVTDYPRRLAIADSLREKFLARLHQELPHELGVAVKSLDDSKPGRWEVKADILVNRATQRPIVIGRGAEIIKAARKSAERELSAAFGVKVTMEVWVRVEPGWMKNPRILAEMGYLSGE